MPPAHGGRPRSQVQVRQPDAEVSRLARLLSPHEMGRRVSSVLLPKNIAPRTCRPTEMPRNVEGVPVRPVAGAGRHHVLRLEGTLNRRLMT